MCSKILIVLCKDFEHKIGIHYCIEVYKLYSKVISLQAFLQSNKSLEFERLFQAISKEGFKMAHALLLLWLEGWVSVMSSSQLFSNVPLDIVYL